MEVEELRNNIDVQTTVQKQVSAEAKELDQQIQAML